MTTPAKVAEWLRNNDGNLTDAYKAVGYEGKPLKIKEGNLTNNRSKIRLAIRGENGDNTRRAAERLNPPQTKEEQNRLRRMRYKRAILRKAGKNVVIDHVQDLQLLAQTVEGMTPEQARAHIKRLEKSYGPLGNRPDNQKIIGARTNELKRQGSKKLQQHLSKLNKQAFVGKPNYSRMLLRARALGAVIPHTLESISMIDEMVGNPIDRTVGQGVNALKTSLGFEPNPLPSSKPYPVVKGAVAAFDRLFNQDPVRMSALGIAPVKP
jgi:hypothetical protein|tara:strand:+ start:3341 stop:4138 length:798 start_codon:yes stop_codon:yes gene_type:complete